MDKGFELGDTVLLNHRFGGVFGVKQIEAVLIAIDSDNDLLVARSPGPALPGDREFDRRGNQRALLSEWVIAKNLPKGTPA